MGREKRYQVSVFPCWGEEEAGEVCAYFEHFSFARAMAMAGEHAERWLNAPLGDGEEKRGEFGEFTGFEVRVEIGGAS